MARTCDHAKPNEVRLTQALWVGLTLKLKEELGDPVPVAGEEVRRITLAEGEADVVAPVAELTVELALTVARVLEVEAEGVADTTVRGALVLDEVTTGISELVPVAAQSVAETVTVAVETMVTVTIPFDPMTTVGVTMGAEVEVKVPVKVAEDEGELRVLVEEGKSATIVEA
jgi:hypothetical protein